MAGVGYHESLDLLTDDHRAQSEAAAQDQVVGRYSSS